MKPEHMRDHMNSQSFNSNFIKTPFPDVCIHRRFECQAQKHPEATAVTFEGKTLTYGDLNQRSNQLAHYLGTLGVGPGTLVGLFVQKSIEAITGILGVLKNGCAYVPLDPAYPKERLKQMMEDTESPVVLTLSNLKKTFPDTEAGVICLDSDWEMISCEKRVNPESAPTPDSLAYVIFTSGSTGRPKGVCCHHRGVINLLSDFQNRRPIGPGDICSWWTSLNFDVSVYEIFSPLMEGASLAIVPESVRGDAPVLMDWLHKEKVTSAYLPPFMVADLDVWVREHPEMSALRRLLVGVEAIPEGLLNSIDHAVPGLHIINGYGPTETTVCATLYSVGRENDLHENTPIGKPVQNTHIYLLDEEGKRVSGGNPGELCVGGVGVANGYLNRPDLTAERFVQDPFFNKAGAQLYKTGDLARLMPDGNMEFIGRADFQVKFHGYRVELGEIETILRKHPAIREAVVLLREDIPGVKRLVAYLVCYEEEGVWAKEFRTLLKESLPDYMVPSVFVFLDKIPMTPNGKTDRSALAPPTESDFSQMNMVKYEPPRSREEKVLARFFEQLLGLGRVGLRDNFFDLGGHSLLATRLCAEIEGELGVRISIKSVFEGSTVAELAKTLLEAKEKGAGKVYSEIRSSSRARRSFPMSYLQQGMWMMHQFDPSGISCNIPLLVRMDGALREDAFHGAVNEMVKRHEILRTTFLMEDRNPVQRIHSHMKIPIPMVDLSTIPPAERETKLKRISAEEGRHRFDPAKGPLLKMVLVRFGKRDYRAVFNIHHIIMDGFSASIFFRELGALYEAFVFKRPRPLPVPPIQYADFSLWQREWVQTEGARKQVDYWKEKLKFPPKGLNMPFDFTRPAQQTHAGSRYLFDFPPSLTRELNRVSREEGVSLYMLLLAAYQILLHQYSNQDDIIVGSPVANRKHPQVEDTIGIFINALAMRTRFSGDPSFHEVLGQVRKTALEAYENQDIPFEMVTEALATERDASRNPIFQVSFILQNTPPPFIRSADLDMSYDEMGNNTSKLDLLLNLEEREGCLEGWFQYNPDLFMDKTIEGIAIHLLKILNVLVSDTSQRISKCPRVGIERGPEIPGVEASYPLSPMQEGMLFESLSVQEPGVDVEQIIIRLNEDLNPSILRASWEKVVARHGAMRTSLRWVGVSSPHQDVHGQVKLLWDRQNWRDLSQEEQKERLRSYLRSDRHRGFSLDEPPLMRFALFRIDEAGYDFLWTFHHSLLDGRSFLIVLREVFSLYEAACNGQEPGLETPRPYRNYIEWLQQQDKSESGPFWRETLKGFTAPTRMRIAGQFHMDSGGREGHGEEEIRLSESMTSSLRLLAEQHEVTVNTIFQGAWALLLSRYSGEEDVVYGATRAGRHWSPAGSDEMVGLFINTLPVRVTAPPDAQLGSWLKKLRRQHVAVRKHEHVPLIDIQGWSDVPRGVSLFETLVVFENFLLDSALKAQGGLWANRDLTLLEQTRFPLTLSGYLESELILRIEYDRSRYGKLSISRMLTHLRTLLEGMADQPERTLASIPILSGEEKRRVLVEWNDTETDYPEDERIHQLFEAQAARTPHRTAVVHNGKELSYDQLNKRANQLAHHLMGLGVKSHMPVGLFIERSFHMVVGVLGILKAGGAYLPLDPSYPEERVAFMIHDSKTPVIVTRKRQAESLPEHEAQTVLMDSDWDIIMKKGDENPSVQFPSANPAYVMYTSGSTGQPKGVLVPHGGVVNHCLSVTPKYGIRSEDRVLQFFSINFDGFVEELFPAWSMGAAVILRSEEMSASTANFMQWIEQEDISVINLPTAFWHELVNGLALSGEFLPKALRVVIVGGEKASMSAYATWAEISKGRVRWFNTYGPTECTVVSTIYEPDDSVEYKEAGLDLPIGKPIANTRIYVLDKNLQPLPIGVPGEMLIGGAGVAGGYLNRPELTAERFIKDPFSHRPGDRLYKTGDLVRYLPDGNIEFVGRTDFQVKFRGFRIEPGEIERVIDQHPSVRKSVVMLREDIPGRKYLAAYWTEKDGGSLASAEPREFLMDKLPEYMVPTAFVLVDVFPLSPNGKVDRKALPVPKVTGIESDVPYVAPRNQTENVLTRIWAEVLGIERIGIHDNFFELGGHSLLTLQVLDRAHRERIDLTPQQMFKSYIPHFRMNDF